MRKREKGIAPLKSIVYACVCKPFWQPGAPNVERFAAMRNIALMVLALLVLHSGAELPDAVWIFILAAKDYADEIDR